MPEKVPERRSKLSFEQIASTDIDELAFDLGRALNRRPTQETVTSDFTNAARYIRMTRFTVTQEQLYFPRGVELTVVDPALDVSADEFEKLPRPERKIIEAIERLGYAFEQFAYRRNASLDKTEQDRRKVFVRRLIEDSDPLLNDIALVKAALEPFEP